MTATREELHHLVDQLGDDEVGKVTELIRELTHHGLAAQRRRTVRSLGIADADPDLAKRSDEILRRELGEGRPAWFGSFTVGKSP